MFILINSSGFHLYQTGTGLSNSLVQQVKKPSLLEWRMTWIPDVTQHHLATVSYHVSRLQHSPGTNESWLLYVSCCSWCILHGKITENPAHCVREALYRPITDKESLYLRQIWTPFIQWMQGVQFYIRSQVQSLSENLVKYLRQILWMHVIMLLCGISTIISHHLSAPSHHLNQCWNFVYWTRRNKLQWNFNRNSNIFIKENVFQKCRLGNGFQFVQFVSASMC